MTHLGFSRNLLSCLLVASAALVNLACASSPKDSKSAGDENTEVHTDSLGTYPDSGQAEEVDLGCEDGTCFACGDGLCPQGAYCDQDAQGGGACAWLSECPATPTCACLTQVLGSSCGCEENEGGPLVSCQ